MTSMGSTSSSMRVRKGAGYFIARDYRDSGRNVDIEEEFTIQEYVLGCRYYLHFFFDPLATDGYQVQGRGKYAGKNLGRPRTSFRGSS